jgi:hypothetical protein
MCCRLVQVGRAGGKWKGFSGDVCWFGTGWGKGREMERFHWWCVGLVQGGGEVGKWKGFSGDVCWFGTGWGVEGK